MIGAACVGVARQDKTRQGGRMPAASLQCEMQKCRESTRQCSVGAIEAVHCHSSIHNCERLFCARCVPCSRPNTDTVQQRQANSHSAPLVSPSLPTRTHTHSNALTHSLTHSLTPPSATPRCLSLSAHPRQTRDDNVCAATSPPPSPPPPPSLPPSLPPMLTHRQLLLRGLPGPFPPLSSQPLCAG
jgi:hypothetical protein